VLLVPRAAVRRCGTTVGHSRWIEKIKKDPQNLSRRRLCGGGLHWL